MNFFTKKLTVAVFAACMISSMLVAVGREELLARVGKATSESKPCLFFESYGKFPHAIVYYPIKNEIRDILFACDRDGSVDFVTTPEDFVNLIPAKLRVSNPLNATFNEKKYKGFVVDKVVMKAISSNNYETQFKKPFMVSEYERGMDMKWVFGSVEQFQGFKCYFLKNISMPATKKPFLVLEIEKNPEALTEEDVTFLNEYFEVADLSNPEMKARADKIDASIQKASHDAFDYATHQVGKSLNDMLVDDVDDKFCGFERKKLTHKVLMYGLVLLLISVPYLYKNHIEKIADKYLRPHLPFVDTLDKWGSKPEWGKSPDKPFIVTVVEKK